MEFQHRIGENIGNFIIINSEDVVAYYKINNDDRRRSYLQVERVLDALGELSAQEQFLKAPITTFKNLINTNQRVYMAIDPDYNDGKGAATGYVKVGEKKLFLTDGSREQVACDVLCVLDFYVLNTQQRRGWGKLIFDYMIEMEVTPPGEMAYDRPSPKLISFLEKHYSLSNIIWQPNRYTVYRNYFYQYHHGENGSTRGYEQVAAAGASSHNSKCHDSMSKIIQQVPPSP